MDPRETLRVADQAVSDLDANTARAALSTYQAWRARGGYEPYDVAGSSDHGDAFARKTATRLEDLERDLTR